MAFLCVISSAQIVDSGLKWPNSFFLSKQGCPHLRFCDPTKGKSGDTNPSRKIDLLQNLAFNINRELKREGLIQIFGLKGRNLLETGA